MRRVWDQGNDVNHNANAVKGLQNLMQRIHHYQLRLLHKMSRSCEGKKIRSG